MAILLLILFIVVGAYREVLFVNINNQIEFDSGRKAAYHVVPHLQFLGDYTLSALELAKWALTIVTMAVNFGLSALTIRYVLRRPAIRWLIYLYVTGFAVAGLSFLSGKLFSQPQLGYTIARAVMGGLQSPFPLMVLIPALHLSASLEKTTVID